MDWATVRAGVADVSTRVAGLVGGLDPAALDRPALGRWSVGDLAAHLTHAWEFDALLATGAPSPLDDLSRLGDLTQMLVAGETCREPSALAGRIQAAGRSFLASTGGLRGDEPRAWLGGVPLPVSGLACQAISESLMHGHDLAVATSRPWAIPPSQAAMALEGFTNQVLSDPRSHPLLVAWDKAASLRACFNIRLRGHGQAWFVFDGKHGFECRSSPPPGQPVDCHISADPTAMLLVSWGRAGQWPLIAKGKLFAWGRKPWLGTGLASLFRHP